MPIFEFKCSPCDTHKELIVGSQYEPPSCTSCGKTMTKQISLSSFRLYGSGFYKPNER